MNEVSKIRPKKSQLTEWFITEYADVIDWNLVSEHINIPSFSKQFFHKFKTELNWSNISSSNKSITTEFAHEWEKEIGSKRWYENGELHRLDGPAFICNNNFRTSSANFRLLKVFFIDEQSIPEKHSKKYFGNESYLAGKYMSFLSGGKEEWYQHGMLHREDGPAVTWHNRSKMWCENGFFIKEEGE